MKEKIESGQQASVKNIKDYIHLYLDCEILIDPNEDESPYIDVIEGLVVGESVNLKKSDDYYFDDVNEFSIKPILRQLSDMTEEEAIKLAKIHGYDIPEDEGVREEVIGIYDCKEGEVITLGAYLPVQKYYDGLLWLLKNSFDLFCLIDSEIAIDKTKLPTHV